MFDLFPKESQPKFDFQVIRESIQFSVGVGSINLLGLLLTQMDKIILSTLLPLEQFGYYVLASTIGRSISIVTTPVFNYIFPKFSTLVAEENQEHLSLTYRASNQLMIAIVVPLSLTIAFFAPDILRMWTHNPDIVANVSKPTSILLLNTGLNSLMITPFSLHLAYGETRRWFFMTMGFAGLLFTFLIIVVPNSGTIGASFTWSLLKSLQVLVSIPLAWFYLLPKENVINLFLELLIPIFMSGFSTFIIYSIRPIESWMIPYLLIVHCLNTILSILFCSNLRQRFLSAITNS